MTAKALFTEGQTTERIGTDAQGNPLGGPQAGQVIDITNTEPQPKPISREEALAWLRDNAHDVDAVQLGSGGATLKVRMVEEVDLPPFEVVQHIRSAFGLAYDPIFLQPKYKMHLQASPPAPDFSDERVERDAELEADLKDFMEKVEARKTAILEERKKSKKKADAE